MIPNFRGEVTENENANKYSELSDDDMINGQQEVSITVKVGNIACKEVWGGRGVGGSQYEVAK